MFYDENSFDGVWAMSSLMHLAKSDMLGALKECEKVLEPHGIMYLSLKRGEGESMEMDSRYDVPKYFAYYQDDEVRELLEQTNLEIIDFGGTTADTSYATKPWMDIFLKKH